MLKHVLTGALPVTEEATFTQANTAYVFTRRAEVLPYEDLKAAIWYVASQPLSDTFLTRHAVHVVPNLTAVVLSESPLFMLALMALVRIVRVMNERGIEIYDRSFITQHLFRHFGQLEFALLGCGEYEAATAIIRQFIQEYKEDNREPCRIQH